MKNIEIFKYTFVLAGFVCTSAFAQVKNVSFSEILNPVVVDDGTENIPLIYEAAAAWGDYDNDGFLDLIVSGVTSQGEKTLLYKNKNGRHPMPLGLTIIMMEIWIYFWRGRKVMENSTRVCGKIKEEMPALKRYLPACFL